MDISNTYSNLFFRVNGDKSNFGTVQEEHIPRIDKVKYNGCNWSEADCVGDSGEYEINEGWSHTVSTGHFYNGATETIIMKNQFHSIGGEVRPGNMAIKIWKCV